MCPDGKCLLDAGSCLGLHNYGKALFLGKQVSHANNLRSEICVGDTEFAPRDQSLKPSLQIMLTLKINFHLCRKVGKQRKAIIAVASDEG